MMNSANANSMFRSAKWGTYATAVIVRCRALAPYALIELVLPGGSVMALLLWLYRRRKSGAGIGPLPMKILAFLKLANFLRFKAAVCTTGSDAALG